MVCQSKQILIFWNCIIKLMTWNNFVSRDFGSTACSVCVNTVLVTLMQVAIGSAVAQQVVFDVR